MLDDGIVFLECMHVLFSVRKNFVNHLTNHNLRTAGNTHDSLCQVDSITCNVFCAVDINNDIIHVLTYSKSNFKLAHRVPYYGVIGSYLA